MKTQQIVSFGKYKGQPLDRLQSDASYVRWLLARPSFEEKQPELHAHLTAVGSAREETPEHNEIQIRFLDDNYAFSFLWLFPRFKKFLANRLQEIKVFNKKAHEGQRAWPLEHRLRDIEFRHSLMIEFEERDWDLSIRYTIHGKTPHDLFPEERDDWTGDLIAYRGAPRGWVYKPGFLYADNQLWSSIHCWLELKPVIGDDYPSILRQIKKRYRASPYDPLEPSFRALAFEYFDARSITMEQIQRVFALSGIDLKCFSEVRLMDKSNPHTGLGE